ncbi:unnamed protein product [Amoebophrya sp. A25]|nr:unnamed protein product [Amoebophrya sp. A25]|eukprot:GSA25T00003931001.1
MKRNRWGKNKDIKAAQPTAASAGNHDGGAQENDDHALAEADDNFVTTVDDVVEYPRKRLKRHSMSSQQQQQLPYRNDCGELALKSYVKLPLADMLKSDDYSADLRACLIGGGIYIEQFFRDPKGLVMDTILAEVVASDNQQDEGTMGEDSSDGKNGLSAHITDAPEFRAPAAAANSNTTTTSAAGGPAGGGAPKTKAWSKHQVIENCSEKSVTFARIIAVLEEYFDVDIFATRLNYYENQEHWKPFHKDSHAYGANGMKEDFTVGVSFGAERALEFQHDDCTAFRFAFPQRNGDVFAFSDVVNKKFKHGVPKMTSGEKRGARISIIGWGRRRKMTKRNGGIAEGA